MFIFKVNLYLQLTEYTICGDPNSYVDINSSAGVDSESVVIANNSIESSTGPPGFKMLLIRRAKGLKMFGWPEPKFSGATESSKSGTTDGSTPTTLFGAVVKVAAWKKNTHTRVTQKRFFICL